MYSFLFTARNHQGKTVTERIEAENLSEAKQNLEAYGYSAISFFDSELSEDILNTFDEKMKKAHKNCPKELLQQNVEAQYRTSYWYHLLFQLKSTWIFWLIIIGVVVYAPSAFTFGLLSLLLVGFIYLNVPPILHNKAMTAYFSLKNSKARFWVNMLDWFNLINYYQFPQFEIDIRYAILDAREGNLQKGLQRISKYEHQPKISKRMFNNNIISIYNNAQKFDEVLKQMENTLREGFVYQEEVFDYAICLIRRHKQPTLAKQILEKVYEFELTVLAKLFLPYCKGLIELEEGNLSKAEFYLKMANEEMKPFKKNQYLYHFPIESMQQ